MSVTAQENLYNLGSASQLAMQSIRHAYDNDPDDPLTVTLDLISKSEWSQVDRLRFIKALAQKILQYQDRFSPETLAYANTMLGQNFGGLTFDEFIYAAPDGSATLQKIFADSLVDTALDAGASVASIGNGVLNVFKKTGSAAGKYGDALDNVAEAMKRLTAAASTPGLPTLAVFGVVGLLLLLVFKETKRALK